MLSGSDFTLSPERCSLAAYRFVKITNVVAVQLTLLSFSLSGISKRWRPPPCGPGGTCSRRVWGKVYLWSSGSLPLTCSGLRTLLTTQPNLETWSSRRCWHSWRYHVTLRRLRVGLPLDVVGVGVPRVGLPHKGMSVCLSPSVYLLPAPTTCTSAVHCCVTM